jgi:hypothetical protein
MHKSYTILPFLLQWKTDLMQVLSNNNNNNKSSSSSSSSITKQALSAGASKMHSLVELKDVSLCCGDGRGGGNNGGEFSTGEYLFPLSSSTTSPLHAIVSDFPQEQYVLVCCCCCSCCFMQYFECCSREIVYIYISMHVCPH